MKFFRREEVHVIHGEPITLGELFIELFTREEKAEPTKANKTPPAAKLPSKNQKIRNAFHQRFS
jgi:hypothetical protein